jgi:outer membrane protein assembly factor BamB
MVLRILPILCLVGLDLASVGTNSTVRGEDWPQWQGVRGDSRWEGPAFSHDWEKAPPRQVWKSSISPGYSGIAVVGNRLYSMDRPTEPKEHERITCRDTATGDVVWEHLYPAVYGKLDYPKGPRATPTVHDGRVYTMGAVGHVHCLDAREGRVLWKVDLVRDQKAVLSTWGYSSSPLIDGPRVVIHAGIPQGGCYVAYDRVTGQEIWRAGNDSLGYGTPIQIEHAGTRQLIGWTPEHIISLSPSDGRENWRIPYKVTYGVSIATPLFRDGIVLVCGYWEGSKAIRLGAQASEATLLWEENRYLRGLMAPPLYRDRHVYLLDKQHGIVCFELATGKKVWTDENRLTPRDRNPQASLVWLGASDRVLALNASGELVHARFTPEKYEELGRIKLVGETWAHPAFAGHSVYARDDSQLVRFDLASP